MTDKQRPDLEYVMVMHGGHKITKFYSEDYCKDLMEQLAFAQSREVCTVAHETVDTCGYCQRDALLTAAGKVTCKWCSNTGVIRGNTPPFSMPCPDCHDLRRLLGESHG